GKITVTVLPSPETHSKYVNPNYEVFFPQDSVNRIDLTFINPHRLILKGCPIWSSLSRIWFTSALSTKRAHLSRLL
ncbi:MAG TPA: hypothetical protein PLR56_05185, partial [Brevefilum sp.]|nr:hypothetical protein [Brevefilum sp.]